tara:strand:+ start:829 stop:1110 length:282 start_codon:yes stop_codon:yes gene_type:complete
MKTITQDKAKELINNTNGKIFSSVFTKKCGSIRLMTGRLKVTKHLKENAKPRPYDPDKYNLICLFDMINKGYRMINIETLKQITVNKTIYKIK